MADVFNTVSGNKMFELRQAVLELRERLKTEEDPDVIAEIKKEIMEKVSTSEHLPFIKNGKCFFIANMQKK